MDNKNPKILSADELQAQKYTQPKREIRNLWISDYLTFSSEDKLDDSKKNKTLSVSTFSELLDLENFSIHHDTFDANEIFELICNLTDPEHPLTLEQLAVVSPHSIDVDNKKNYVRVYFTPTIPHCSQAALIGLMIQTKLSRCLPTRFKIDVYITPGMHEAEQAINKQLNDKERVAAALDNPQILKTINRGFINGDADEAAHWSII